MHTPRTHRESQFSALSFRQLLVVFAVDKVHKETCNGLGIQNCGQQVDELGLRSKFRFAVNTGVPAPAPAVAVGTTVP